jgi:hypothetical protein
MAFLYRVKKPGYLLELSIDDVFALRKALDLALEGEKHAGPEFCSPEELRSWRQIRKAVN